MHIRHVIPAFLLMLGASTYPGPEQWLSTCQNVGRKATTLWHSARTVPYSQTATELMQNAQDVREATDGLVDSVPRGWMDTAKLVLGHYWNYPGSAQMHFFNAAKSPATYATIAGSGAAVGATVAAASAWNIPASQAASYGYTYGPLALGYACGASSWADRFTRNVTSVCQNIKDAFTTKEPRVCRDIYDAEEDDDTVLVNFTKPWNTNEICTEDKSDGFVDISRIRKAAAKIG